MPYACTFIQAALNGTRYCIIDFDLPRVADSLSVGVAGVRRIQLTVAAWSTVLPEPSLRLIIRSV
jgi:hypothetical protein